ncbi:MAG: ABC transporter permease [Dermatophilaceae bacterium]
MSTPTITIPQATSTGSWNVVRLIWHDMSYGLRAVTRSPLTMVLALLFPLIFNVLFNVLGDGQTRGGVSNVQFTTAAIVVFVIALNGYLNMSISIVVAREKSVLKRIRQTPVPRVAHLCSRILLATILSAFSVLVMVAISMVAFGLELSAVNAAALTVMFTISCFAFSALGIAVTRLMPTVESGMVVAVATLFPVMFISGTFFPVDSLPGWLATATEFLPLVPANNAVRAAFIDNAGASAFAWTDLAILTAWAVGGLAVAIRTMPWEPVR